MEDKLNNTTEVEPKQLRKQTKVISVNWRRYSIAASIAILFGLVGFMKFYTVEFNSVNGGTLSLTLPDNSKVLLNGESSIQYNPYWWSFNRQLTFEGEAFFVPRHWTHSVLNMQESVGWAIEVQNYML